MSYSHLNIGQRYEIDVLRRAGHSQASIARMIGVHPSTISRELHRNGRNDRYGAATAHQRSIIRRSRASSTPRKMTPEVCEQIDAALRQEQWSPEQISARLPMLGLPGVSHETIYLHVLEDKRAGGDLHTHLRQARKKRRKRYGSHDRRGSIPNRRSIDDRPAIVADRSRIGDWELDTVVGTEHQGAVVTLVERKTRLTLIRRVDRATAEEVAEAVVEMTRGYRPKMLTITSDNGREFAWHEEIGRRLGVDIYFAHPYHSWERGTNENTNGLIRQYFPKGTNFRQVSDESVAEVQKKLNRRPRKTLGFRTPDEEYTGRFLRHIPTP